MRTRDPSTAGTSVLLSDSPRHMTKDSGSIPFKCDASQESLAFAEGLDALVL